jgi:hypothetical protein
MKPSEVDVTKPGLLGAMALARVAQATAISINTINAGHDMVNMCSTSTSALVSAAPLTPTNGSLYRPCP